MSQEIKAKLLTSPSTLSLLDEQRISVCLERLKWNVDHGVYYTDETEGKDRELDILATQHWTRKLRSGDQRCFVQMIVEAKTLKDYHVIAAAPRQVPDIRVTAQYWLGRDPEFLRSLQARIREHGGNEEIISRWSRTFGKLAFPKYMAAPFAFLSVPPPPAIHFAGTFRETNSANERELESSVLWKAGRSLRSAYRAEIGRRREYHLGWISPIDESDRITVDGDFMYAHVRMADIFQPVVVLRSHLWIAANSDIQEVPWFRFIQNSGLAHASWWFDVVREDSFQSYAVAATEHYAKHFKKIRASPYKSKGIKKNRTA